MYIPIPRLRLPLIIVLFLVQNCIFSTDAAALPPTDLVYHNHTNMTQSAPSESDYYPPSFYVYLNSTGGIVARGEPEAPTPIVTDCQIPARIRCDTTGGSPRTRDVLQGSEYWKRTRPDLRCVQKNPFASACTTMKMGNWRHLDYPEGFPKNDMFSVRGNLASFSLCNWAPHFASTPRMRGSIRCQEVGPYADYLIKYCQWNGRVGGTVRLAPDDCSRGVMELVVSTANTPAEGPPFFD